MKLFISWSGQTSQAIANELRVWFPLILPSVSPFITTTDIEKGAQWQGAIKTELEKSNYGLVVLTPRNLGSQWLAFEAGALSKHLEGRVATLLFNTAHSDVKPPLSLFQGTLFAEEEFRRLVSDINKAVQVDNRRTEDQLDTLFPMLWPKLREPIELILQSANEAAPIEEPSAKDIATQEVLALLRQQNAVLSSPEKFLAPLIGTLEARIRRLEGHQATTADVVTVSRVDGELSKKAVQAIVEELRAATQRTGAASDSASTTANDP